MEPQGFFQIHPRVYLKSQKEEKDESNVEKKWYNKHRRK